MSSGPLVHPDHEQPVKIVRVRWMACSLLFLLTVTTIMNGGVRVMYDLAIQIAVTVGVAIGSRVEGGSPERASINPHTRRLLMDSIREGDDNIAGQSSCLKR